MLDKIFGRFKKEKVLFEGNSADTFIDNNTDAVSGSKKQHTEHDLAKAYTKWVYFCVNKNADAIASTDLKMIATTSPREPKVMLPSQKFSLDKYKHDKSLINTSQVKQAQEIEEITAHPFLTLLEKPNKQDTQYTFIYKLITNMELFGTGFIRVQKNNLKIPSQMEILHTQFVNVRKDGYGNPYYAYGFGKNRIDIPANEIVRVTYYNPNSDTSGFSPLNAIYEQHQLDMSFDAYQSALNENQGNPGTIIKYTGTTLTNKERKKLEAQWNKVVKGVSKSGKTKVIDNDFEVIKLGVNPKELDYVNGRRVTKESIFASFGVPLSFADPKDVNRSSYDIALHVYQLYTVLPKIRQIVDDLNNFILDAYQEPRIKLTFENPVESFNYTKVIELFNAGIINQDEAREQVIGN